jgi:hypothetical protein
MRDGHLPASSHFHLPLLIYVGTVQQQSTGTS